MASITLVKFHLNPLMVTLIFGMGASEPPQRPAEKTQKAKPDRGNTWQKAVFLVPKYLSYYCNQKIFIKNIDAYCMSFSGHCSLIM